MHRRARLFALSLALLSASLSSSVAAELPPLRAGETREIGAPTPLIPDLGGGKVTSVAGGTSEFMTLYLAQDYHLFVLPISADGKDVGKPRRLAETSQHEGGYNIAFDGTHYRAFWRMGPSVRTASMAVDGEVLSTTEVAAEGDGLSPVRGVCGGNGECIVVWSADSTLRATRLNAAGELLPAKPVTLGAVGPVITSISIASAGNRHYVFWTTGDDTNLHTDLALLASDGTSLGAARTVYEQTTPELEAASDGKIVAVVRSTWRGSRVLGSLFDLKGNLLPTEFGEGLAAYNVEGSHIVSNGKNFMSAYAATELESSIDYLGYAFSLTGTAKAGTPVSLSPLDGRRFVPESLTALGQHYGVFGRFDDDNSFRFLTVGADARPLSSLVSVPRMRDQRVPFVGWDGEAFSVIWVEEQSARANESFAHDRVLGVRDPFGSATDLVDQAALAGALRAAFQGGSQMVASNYDSLLDAMLGEAVLADEPWPLTADGYGQELAVAPDPHGYLRAELHESEFSTQHTLDVSRVLRSGEQELMASLAGVSVYYNEQPGQVLVPTAHGTLLSFRRQLAPDHYQIEMGFLSAKGALGESRVLSKQASLSKPTARCAAQQCLVAWASARGLEYALLDTSGKLVQEASVISGSKRLRDPQVVWDGASFLLVALRPNLLANDIVALRVGSPGQTLLGENLVAAPSRLSLASDGAGHAAVVSTRFVDGRTFGIAIDTTLPPPPVGDAGQDAGVDSDDPDAGPSEPQENPAHAGNEHHSQGCSVAYGAAQHVFAGLGLLLALLLAMRRR